MTEELISTPEWGEVRDYESQYEPVTVPVKITGTPNVYERPAKRGVMRQLNVPAWNDTNAVPIEVVPADPRIKHVWLQAWGSNPGVLFIGTHEQVVRNNGVNATDAFRYDGSAIWGPLEGFDEPLYAFASTTGQNILSVRIEYWAD
jgi:hypothetical protein